MSEILAKGTKVRFKKKTSPGDDIGFINGYDSTDGEYDIEVQHGRGILVFVPKDHILEIIKGQ